MNTHKDKGDYPIYKSKCCGVGVSVSGIGITQYYVCNKCDKPCDFVPMTTSSKTNMNALKKDFQMRFTWKQSGYRNMRDRCTQELWQWIQTAISKAREEEREKVVKEIKEFVGDPGEVNGPWFMPVKTLFTFLDKLLTQKK